MEKVQSRQTPPPQPNDISRISAPISREQITPQIPFQTVLNVVAEKLQLSGRELPEKQRLSFFPVRVVGLATNNGAREFDISSNFPDVRFKKIRATELHTRNTRIDAASKADSAAQNETKRRKPMEFLRDLRSGTLHKADVIVAFDAVNVIPYIGEDGIFTMKPLGKPDGEFSGNHAEEIQNRLAQLAKLAKDNNWQSVPYIIDSTTHARKRRGNCPAPSTRQMVVFLNTEKLASLSTPEGFKTYREIARKTEPLLEKTAGGIKWEVFKEIGAIDYLSADPEEIKSGVFDKTDQEKAYIKAGVLAAGLVDRTHFQNYMDKFPKKSFLRR